MDKADGDVSSDPGNENSKVCVLYYGDCVFIVVYRLM